MAFVEQIISLRTDIIRVRPNTYQHKPIQEKIQEFHQGHHAGTQKQTQKTTDLP